MYSTCTFCHASLGANDVLEHFPVGRRIAFDPARGRLWVVCTVCRQWNLTPLDARWEAIEEGERWYRDARLRVATDQVGLARMADGTELIRIGEPLRPEFAAWRYGDRFAARWRIRGRISTAGAGALALTKGWSGFMLWQVAAVPIVALGSVEIAAALVSRRRTAAYLTRPSGERLRLSQKHLDYMMITRDADAPEGWRLEVPHAPVESPNRFYRKKDPVLVLTGAEARGAAARLLPRMNRAGGHKRTVEEAISILARHGNANAVLRYAGAQASIAPMRVDWADLSPETGRDGLADVGGLANAPAAVRLAAEMAVHEETERAVMAGELADLEAQWREAEEIAAIADNLTLAPGVLRALERLRLR